MSRSGTSFRRNCGMKANPLLDTYISGPEISSSQSGEFHWIEEQI